MSDTPLVVGAAAARETVRQLRDAGMSLRRVCEVSGVAPATLDRLLFGQPSKGQAPSKRIDRVTADALLTVTLDPGAVIWGRRVLAIGSARRLQALQERCWSLSSLASRLPRKRLALIAISGGRRRMVDRSTAEAIKAVYGELWDQLPLEETRGQKIAATMARNRARAAGWPPPAAWDDESIDDPEGMPHGAASSSDRSGDGHIDDYSWLRSERFSIGEAAERLGVTLRTAQRYEARIKAGAA
jgi:transcriptional regulator with XRE-family HTH domain